MRSDIGEGKAELLTIEDVDERYKVSRATVYRHCAKWPSQRVGRRRRFRADQLDAYFSGQVVVPAATPSGRHLIVARSYLRREKCGGERDR